MTADQNNKTPLDTIEEFAINLLHFCKTNSERLLLSGGVVVIALLCFILPLLLQDQASGEVSSAGFSSLSTTTPVYAGQAEEEDLDIFDTALMTGEFASTVLGETADAGADYVKETLFIGDSNTAGMLLNSSVTNVTMSNGIGIVSMGISHVTSLRCVKFSGMGAVAVPEAVQILQPRRIVITYGTNDYYMTPEKFAEAYKTALEAIEGAYPFADIIIGSIFPITANCSYFTVTMPTIEKFNLELVKLAQEKDLNFLNWSEAIKDPATGYCKPEYMAGDGVHLSKSGMEKIFAYFRTHKLDGEDRRPKPLNPIPVREATPVGLLGVGLPKTEEAPPPEEEEPQEQQPKVQPEKPPEEPPEEPPVDPPPVDPPPVDPPPVDPPPVDPPPDDPPPPELCPVCKQPLDKCICEEEPEEPDDT